MLKDKVREYITRHGLLRRGGKVLVAVSGGPDSLCLLHLLKTMAADWQAELVVAHLNHGFRAEAHEEAELVRRLAREWGLAFVGASADVPAYRSRLKISAQEAARRVRYRFLLAAARLHGAGTIALGHHRDDQAETVLLNILRGTGPDGLAGMSPLLRLGKVRLIRPLLEISRQEIEAYCRRHNLKPAMDSSNLKTDYTRNRARLELLPYLREHFNPRVTDSLLRLSRLAAADRRFMQNQTRRVYAALVHKRGQQYYINIPGFLALPEALRGRLARVALAAIARPGETGWSQVDRVLSLARQAEPYGQFFLPGKSRVRREGKYLILSPPQDEEVAAKPGYRCTLRVPGKTHLKQAGMTINARLCDARSLSWPPSPSTAYLDFDRLKFPLAVCSRWPGARFHPQGMPASTKLKNFFNRQKISPEKRDDYPLVISGKEIVWVVGLRIAHPYRITASTTRALVLECINTSKKRRNIDATTIRNPYYPRADCPARR